MKNKLTLVEWAATILSIIGAIFNAFLYKEGFYFWIVANTLWVYFGLKYKHYGMVVLFSVYFLISVVGIIYWN